MDLFYWPKDQFDENGQIVSEAGVLSTFVQPVPTVTVGRVVTGFKNISTASVAIGRWTSVTESMFARAAAYKARITGAPAGQGVKFDGFRAGQLIEAKGPGYANFVNKSGSFYDWYKGADALVSQAIRQLNAASGTAINWYIAEEKAAIAISRLFTERGIKGIKLIIEK